MIESCALTGMRESKTVVSSGEAKPATSGETISEKISTLLVAVKDAHYSKRSMTLRENRYL
jgi:hypothetical protein